MAEEDLARSLQEAVEEAIRIVHKEKKELPEDYWENHHRELERNYPGELEAVKQESIHWNNGKYDYDKFLDCLDLMRCRYKEGYYDRD